MALSESSSTTPQVNVNSEHKTKSGSNRFLYVSSGTLSDTGRFLVVGALYGEELLQLPLQGLKSGSLHLLLPPTLQHDIVQRLGTVRGTGHSVAMFYLVKDFSIGHTYSKIERACMHTAIESVNQIIIVHYTQFGWPISEDCCFLIHASCHILIHLNEKDIIYCI